MTDGASILVLGLDELASAVARQLLLSGHAVAMHLSAEPDVLLRKMAFSDAWHGEVVRLEGVEARRVDHDADLVAAMRSRMHIPVLAQAARETIARWPWDILIDAQRMATQPWPGSVELAIGLGPGMTAGVDCDLVIETDGPDPGKVLRHGAARASVSSERYDHALAAPAAGPFYSERAIGEVVEAGELIGLAGVMPIHAPCAGRIRGLRRPGGKVGVGSLVADIARDKAASVSGIRPADRIVARAVALAIEVEQQGFSADRWRP